MKNLVELLAREGNGAIQVDESPEKVPLIVTLIGPIKFWWNEGEWDSPRHKQFTEWRTAVRVAAMKAGTLVYSPDLAFKGSWNELAQEINNAAILISDYIVVLTPSGIPADGTDEEEKFATEHGKKLIYAPPGDDEDLVKFVEKLK